MGWLDLRDLIWVGMRVAVHLLFDGFLVDDGHNQHELLLDRVYLKLHVLQRVMHIVWVLLRGQVVELFFHLECLVQGESRDHECLN